MNPVILYHSLSRIWRLCGISLFCVAIAAFTTVNPPDQSYHGPYASLAAALGPMALRWLEIFFGVGAVALLIACLKLALSSEQEAARADSAGITIRTIWRTKQFVWDEITEVSLKATAYGRHSTSLLKIVSDRRWAGVLSTSTIRGGDSAVQEFVATANSRMHQVRARRVRASDPHLIGGF
jgi:hypothetical protein